MMAGCLGAGGCTGATEQPQVPAAAGGGTAEGGDGGTRLQGLGSLAS